MTQARPRTGARRRPRPQVRAAQTRAAILAAAERSFAAGGLAGARTGDIAAAAGVNKAMLFYHFKSKEQLYEAVLEEHFAAFNRQALDVLSAAGPARVVLLRYVDLQFEFIRAHHRYARLFQQLMLGESGSLERLVQKHFVPRAKALDRLLARGMREGEFRRVDRLHASISIAALVVFYFSAAQVVRVLSRVDAYSARHLARRKREVIDFIRYGLFADPEAPLP